MSSRPAERVSGGEGINEDGDSNFSGMEVTFLGTSSGSPSFTRNVSSYALRLTDEIWLFDCGEATQHQLMRSHLKYSKITRIFITPAGDLSAPGSDLRLIRRQSQLNACTAANPTVHITGPPGVAITSGGHRCSRTCWAEPRGEDAAPGSGVAGVGAGDRADPRGFARRPPRGGRQVPHVPRRALAG